MMYGSMTENSNEDEIALVMESEATDVKALGKLAITWGQLKTD